MKTLEFLYDRNRLTEASPCHKKLGHPKTNHVLESAIRKGSTGLADYILSICAIINQRDYSCEAPFMDQHYEQARQAMSILEKKMGEYSSFSDFRVIEDSAQAGAYLITFLFSPPRLQSTDYHSLTCSDMLEQVFGCNLGAGKSGEEKTEGSVDLMNPAFRYRYIIPGEIIPQIIHNDFSALKMEQEKQREAQKQQAKAHAESEAAEKARREKNVPLEMMRKKKAFIENPEKELNLEESSSVAFKARRIAEHLFKYYAGDWKSPEKIAMNTGRLSEDEIRQAFSMLPPLVQMAAWSELDEMITKNSKALYSKEWWEFGTPSIQDKQLGFAHQEYLKTANTHKDFDVGVNRKLGIDLANKTSLPNRFPHSVKTSRNQNLLKQQAWHERQEQEQAREIEAREARMNKIALILEIITGEEWIGSQSGLTHPFLNEQNPPSILENIPCKVTVLPRHKILSIDFQDAEKLIDKQPPSDKICEYIDKKYLAICEKWNSKSEELVMEPLNILQPNPEEKMLIYQYLATRTPENFDKENEKKMKEFFRQKYTEVFLANTGNPKVRAQYDHDRNNKGSFANAISGPVSLNKDTLSKLRNAMEESGDNTPKPGG